MRMSDKAKQFLRNLWKGNSLDIRRTGNGRWYDQKVTPDVMSAICDVIVKEGRWNRPFYPSFRSILASKLFKEQMEDVFNKPDTGHPAVLREYDKIIRQPLNVLDSAGLLAPTQKRPKKYKIVSVDAEGLIAEIADSEMFACDFLQLYISESLRQSGLDGDFEKFYNRQDKASFCALKDSYDRFMIANTPINGKDECHRVFPKVLNVRAFVRKKKGAHLGRMSKAPIMLSDIRYNQMNFRDIAAQKPKHIPRQMWKLSSDHPTLGVHVAASQRGRKVIKDVKSFHGHSPEIPDSYSGVGVGQSEKITVEGHHIFPKGEYPEFRDMRENVILLTPTQHSSQAHGGTGEYQVDPVYQGLCLLQKLDTIAACEENPNCNFYSFDVFKGMLALVADKEGKTILCAKNLDGYNRHDVMREILRFYGKKES